MTEVRVSAHPPDLTVMLTGDVMLGRGIDQILPNPSTPELYEPFVRSALDYVELAERIDGPLPRAVDSAYVWGDVLKDLAMHPPDLRIVNLETAVTRASAPADKGIHYRMNPANLPTLLAVEPDCCILANNHVLDWGTEGLVETLRVLAAAGVATAGAGLNSAEAEASLMLGISGKGRARVHAFGCPSSGVPRSWAAGPERPGVHVVDERSADETGRLMTRIREDRNPADVVIVSIHWGSNWGYGIPAAHRALAHRLIDEAGVDIVHGHSSHHPKAVEFHHGRAILYGVGDLINDYEGISGEEACRPELALIYLLMLAPDGACRDIRMLPYRIARFRLNRANAEEARWLCECMARECARFGGRVERDADLLRLVPPHADGAGSAEETDRSRRAVQ